MKNFQKPKRVESNLKKIMRIGYVQINPKFGAKEKNFAEVRALLTGVKADLIVLPELFATGYAFTSTKEVQDLAETREGLTADFLREISGRTGAIVVGGFSEIVEGKVYNAALIVQGGQVFETYHKIHLFNKEKLWFTPGERPLKVYNFPGFRLGVMICYDWIFPEVCRTLTLRGMQILAHPANLVLPYCQKGMVTRSLENHIFAVTANRVGREQHGAEDFTFTGLSQITGPTGQVLTQASVAKSQVRVVEIEVKEADNKNLNEFNQILQDRRPSFYVQN